MRPLVTIFRLASIRMFIVRIDGSIANCHPSFNELFRLLINQRAALDISALGVRI